MKKEAALFVAGLIFATGAVAQVYKCPDASGKTVIQQVPCTSGERMTVRPGSGFDRETKRLREMEMAKKRREEQLKKLDEDRKREEMSRRERAARGELLYEYDYSNHRRKDEEAEYEARCGKGFAQLAIGMSKQQVSCVRGYEKPTKVNTTQTAAGVNEQVIYKKKFGGTEYLYFDNGVLTTIQKLD